MDDKSGESAEKRCARDDESEALEYTTKLTKTVRETSRVEARRRESSVCKAPFTRYNQMFVYTIQPVVKPAVKPVVQPV